MDRVTQSRLKGGFDQAAQAYASSRPGYPDPAVDWLLGADPNVGDGPGAGPGVVLGAGPSALSSTWPPVVAR